MKTDYPEGANLYEILKASPDDDISKKLRQAKEFLQPCDKHNKFQDHRMRVKRLNATEYREINVLWKSHNWYKPCEVCKHEEFDPSFTERREKTYRLLCETERLKLHKNSPTARIYRALVKEFPEADHSITDRVPLLVRYLYEIIKQNRMIRVGKMIYQNNRPMMKLSEIGSLMKMEINAALLKKARVDLENTWKETPAVTGTVAFRNGYIKDLQFHDRIDILCERFIDEEYEAVTIETAYPDMKAYTPLDRHVLYAAFGAVILKQPSFTIDIPEYTLKCDKGSKELFKRVYQRIHGVGMNLPLKCQIEFSETKAIQSYVLMKSDDWRTFCGKGPSVIYDHLEYRPDNIPDFVKETLTVRMKKDSPGIFDTKQFKTSKRSGAFILDDNGYRIQSYRGNPSDYERPMMLLIDLKTAYETWCNNDQRQYRDYFHQPSIRPISRELARHGLVVYNPNFDFKTKAAWKAPIESSDYHHRKYVVLGGCLK